MITFSKSTDIHRVCGPKHLMAVPLQDLKDDVERLVNKVGE